VAGAVVTAHGELLVLAVLPLVLMVTAPRAGLPTSVQHSATQTATRCV
jgi:hypothetical protein